MSHVFPSYAARLVLAVPALYTAAKRLGHRATARYLLDFRPMPPVLKVAAFIAQSVAIGLALAFIAVLVKPDLINARDDGAPNQTSYARAVAASAAAVANIYTERRL